MWDRPGTMDRWVSHEYASLNASLVTTKKSLAALLREAEPTCTTRGGDVWPIDRTALERLEAACYLTDPVAGEVLRRAESFGPAFPFRDGRMHLPLSLGVDLISRYKGAIQQVFL